MPPVDRARLLSGLLDRAWERGWATRPSLEPNALVAAAEKRAGGTLAGGSWRDRLAILCQSLEQEAGLSSFGRTVAHGQLVKLLAARRRAEAWLEWSPTAAHRQIAAPVLVVGQMRSGTTRVHRLLACDPRFAVNRLCDQLDPAPYGPLTDWRRPLSARAAGALWRWLDPAVDAIHPTRAEDPEEDFGLLAAALWGAQFEGQWRVPGFAAHCETTDASPVYADYANLLRVIGDRRRIDPLRTWLLKAPQFTQDLPAIEAQFPDARLIVLRRDPAATVASSASLGWHHWRLQSDRVTREEVGREWLRKTQVRAERMARALERTRLPRVELDFDEVSRDWRGSMRAVYAMLGRPLDQATERRMQAYLARPSPHRGHRYRAEDFGLDGQMLEKAFA